MEAPKNKSSSPASTIRWVARILFILAICIFVIGTLIGALVEASGEEVGLGRQIVSFLEGFAAVAVPLIIILVIAWKHELVGGILIELIALATAPYVYSRNYHMALDAASRGRWIRSPGLHALGIIAVVNLPFIIMGVLFIISYFLHRPKKLTAQTP